MNPIIDLLHSHRSIRAFKPDPLPPEHVSAAVRAGQRAATSSAVQAYSVIRVTDPEHRRLLAEWTGPQEKVRTAPEFWVVCGDVRRHMLICERANRTYDQHLEGFLVAVIDATLFAQNAVVALESLGYGTCYIGGLRNHLDRVIELLELPSGVYPVYGVCIGLPDEDPSNRPRLDEQGVFFEDRYPDDEVLLAGVDRYDAVYRSYLMERGASAGAVEAGWSGAILSKHTSPARQSLADVYRNQGARLD